MKTFKKYKIITDIDTEDPLSEYLSVNDIEFHYLPAEQENVPVVDQIPDSSDRKILLIIGIKNLIKLCDQKSKYKNFVDLVKNKKIKLIYYNRYDSLFEINGQNTNLYITEYFENKNNRQDNTDDVRRIENILRGMEFVWWGDYIFGEYVKKHFKNVDFVNLHCSVMRGFPIHHFFHLKKSIEKTKTFFSLGHQKPGREHRNTFFKKIQNESYIKDAIVFFNQYEERKEKVFSDLRSEYGAKFIKKENWLESVPVISYYEKTYFEVLCETYGAIDGDDTFMLTEKTMKPMAMCHPFIVCSTRHFLKNLRTMGFKTFGDLIDESYDECDSLVDRIEIISKNLKRLDMNASRKFYEDSRSIREHNQNHLMYLYGRYKFDLWKKWKDFFGALE